MPGRRSSPGQALGAVPTDVRIVILPLRIEEMKIEEVKLSVIREWDAWAAANMRADQEACGTYGLAFYVDLSRERRDLLMFETHVDPWQTIHGWLLQEGKVND